MIYTVTFNPSLDYVIAVNDFDKGKINKTTAEDFFAGGKGINSVGAGDSMVAGFLAGLINTNNYEQALIKGICAGSASAFSTYFGSIDLIENTIKNYNNTYKN